MKRKIISVCVLFVMFTISACFADRSVPGGISETQVTGKDVVTAAHFAIKAQQEAMQDPKGGPSPKLELLKILKADEQVVAGINYRLTLNVLVNGEERQADVVVWWQSWRKPDPYQLTSWKWATQ